MSEFRIASDNDERIRPDILKLEARIRRNMARRKAALESDGYENKILVDRVISSELAGVPGMDKWLQRTRTIKEVQSQQQVMDEWSHGSLRRTDLHQKYSSPRVRPRDNSSSFINTPDR